MGFFSRLFGMDSEQDKIEEVADRVERFADRFRNANDYEAAEIAENYSKRIRKLKTLDEAYKVEAEFMEKIKDRIPSDKRGTSSTDDEGFVHHHYHTAHTVSDYDSSTAASTFFGSDNTSSDSDSEESSGEFSGAGSSSEFDSGSESFSDNS